MNIHFSPRQRQILTGTLLGDASLRINRRRGRNASFSVTHCDKDKEYLFWKYKELESTGLPLRLPKSSVRQVWGKSYTSWRLASRVHPLLTSYYYLFYPDGKKELTPEVLDLLDDLGLAVWYMDDGALTSIDNGQFFRITMATQGFTLEENKLMRNWLKDKYSLGFWLHLAHGEKWILGTDQKEQVKQFLGIVSPHIIPCMRRKIRLSRG